MLKIAVTGSAGSGKSLVCQRFNQTGLMTLDCDYIARQVVEPGKPGFEKMVELFGSDILGEQGELDRAKLRKILVNDSLLKKKMENILHPQILKEMLAQMEDAQIQGEQAVVVEVPLLFETGMDKFFDFTIAVTAGDEELARRISERDNVTKKDAQKILDLQMSQKDKISRADYHILNKGTKSELFESVDNIFARIQKEFLTI